MRDPSEFKIGREVEFRQSPGVWYTILEIKMDVLDLVVRHPKGMKYTVSFGEVKDVRNPNQKENAMNLYDVKVIRKADKKRKIKVLGKFEDVLAVNEDMARRKVIFTPKFAKMMGKLGVEEVDLVVKSFPVCED